MATLAEVERFEALTEVAGECIVWKGYTRRGYGRFWFRGRLVSAHRWAFEYFFGKIPKGHEIDHTCRIKACVNPSHLEAVTPAENARRRWGAAS